MHHTHHDLVHCNVAIARYPLDHPSMAGFTSQLAEVNRLAETSPGFVWTPADGEAGDAVATFGHPLVLANMSTWRTLEDLRHFVYDSLHGAALKQRRDWFEPMTGPAYVLWWEQSGTRPDWTEAKRRLDYLAQHGDTPRAFGFKRPFSTLGEPLFRSQ
jgi:hypothetical protein